MFRVIFFILLSLSTSAHSFDASFFKKNNESSIPTQQEALRPVDLSNESHLVISFEPNSGGRLYFDELGVSLADKSIKLRDIDEITKSADFIVKYDEFYGNTAVYESKVTFRINFQDLQKYLGSMQGGSKIQISYRGCTTTHGVCYPPDFFEVEVPQNIKPIKESSASLDLGLLFAAIFMGFALSLTPCLYAMIPITLSILKSQKFSSAIFYFIGIISAYYTIGLLVELNSLKAQRILQNPYIYLIMGGFLILAGLNYLRDLKVLSAFDRILSEINRPLNAALSKVNSNNWGALWISGFLSVFILSSCSVPIILGGLGLIGGQASEKSTIYFTAFGFGSIAILIISYTLKDLISNKSNWGSQYFKYGLSILLILSGLFISYESANNLKDEMEYRFEHKEVKSVDDLESGLLIVTSKNCYYCIKMSKEVYSDKDVIQEMNNNKVFVLNLTISNSEKEKVLSTLNVVSYPAIVKVSPSTTEIFYGFLTKEELLEVAK